MEPGSFPAAGLPLVAAGRTSVPPAPSWGPHAGQRGGRTPGGSLLKTGGADSRAVRELQQIYSAAETPNFVLLHQAAALFRMGSYFAEHNSCSW